MSINRTSEIHAERPHRKERDTQVANRSNVDAAWGPGATVPRGGAPDTGAMHLPDFNLNGMESFQRAGRDFQVQTPTAVNEQKIMDQLIQHGLTPVRSAGIVGNLVQESQTDPSKHQLNGGPGFGLAQWGGSRLKQLKQFAAKEGKKESDLNAQVDFLLHELSTTEKGALNAINNTDSAQQATTAFESTFERAGKPNIDNRIDQANRVLAEYKQRGGSGVDFAENRLGNERNT